MEIRLDRSLEEVPYDMPHFGDTDLSARLLVPGDVLAGEGESGADERIAVLMRALSSPTRLIALFALLEFGKLPAGELAKKIGMSPSATSHQLRVLRDLGLVRRCRESRRMIYALADDHLGVLLKEALYHVDHARAPDGSLARAKTSQKTATGPKPVAG